MLGRLALAGEEDVGEAVSVEVDECVEVGRGELAVKVLEVQRRGSAVEEVQRSVAASEGEEGELSAHVEDRRRVGFVPGVPPELWLGLGAGKRA